MFRIAAPRRTVIHRHAFGQSIATKFFCQMTLNRFSSLIRATFQTHGVPRMVIHNRQGMTLHPVPNRKPAFEIHLPELIGSCMLKSLPGRVLGRFFWIDALMTTQDFMNRTIDRDCDLTNCLQSNTDFACSPGGVSIPDFQYLGLHIFAASLRRLMRSPRNVSQPFFTILGIALQPFINGLRTNLVTTANLPNIRIRSICQYHHFSSERHCGHHFLPCQRFHLFRESLTLSKVLPMSPNARYPCLRSIQVMQGGDYLLDSN